MATEKEMRQAVRERKILQSESRWLQKALFALSKADDDRDKLSDDRAETLVVTIEGESYDIDSVTSAVKDAVLARVETLRAATPKGQILTG
jgi:hypothetical protein